MHAETQGPVKADLLFVGVPGATKGVGVLVAKVTYDVRDGKLVPCPQPLPVWAGDQRMGGRLFQSDHVYPKEGVDLVVMGDAVAPGTEPVERMNVDIRLGPLERRFHVWGDRFWMKDGDEETHAGGGPDAAKAVRLAQRFDSGEVPPPWLMPPVPEEEEDEEEDDEEKQEEEKDDTYRISPPAGFRRMRLDWRRAYGGSGFQDNPDGKGFILPPFSKDEKPRVSGVSLPNVEAEAKQIGSWTSRPAPAGCAYYPRSWGLRVLRGLKLRGSKMPEVLAAMFNQAHPDFVLPAFPRGEILSVAGMAPGEGFRAKIEEPDVTARLVLAGRPDRPLNLVWDLICARPEQRQVFMTGRIPFTYDPVTEFDQKAMVTLAWKGGS